MKNKYPLVISSLISLVLIVFFLNGYFSTAQDKLTDLLFTKKTPPPDILLINIDEQSISQIGQWPWPRAIFGQIIDKLQSAKVIGIDINFKESSSAGPADDILFTQVLTRSNVPVILSSQIISDEDSGLNREFVYSLEQFKNHSLQGFTNLIIDKDGVARRVNKDYEGKPSFSFQIAQKSGANPEGFISPVRIHYWNKNGSFSSVSVRDVLSGKIPELFIKNKIVIVGATALDLQDFHETPFGILSGPEIQANSTQTFISNIIYSSNKIIDLLAIVSMAFIATWATFRMSKFGYSVATLVGLFTIYNLVAFLGFDRHFILDLLYPNLALIFAGVSSVSIQYVNASKERKFIHESFGHYLDPQIIEEIIADPSKLKLGGQRKEVTILFTDIRGFTSISEKMTPEQLTHFLNRYLTKMSEIIMDNKGLIDKYIGDAIMAFWGAPLKDEGHALNAVLAAFSMSEALREHNSKKLKDEPEINIGIGLNTGEVTVGNMGSEKRFDYTVIGDAVNLSSRLEGLTKVYGLNILASQSTVNSISPEDIEKYHLVIREIDQVRVKGKTQGIRIYQIVRPDRQAQVRSIKEIYDRGREAYYKGNWNGAISAMKESLTKYPDDGPSKIILDRADKFKQNPPSNWNGTFEHYEK